MPRRVLSTLGLVVACLLFASPFTYKALSAPAPSQSFRITPTAFEFGNLAMGSTSTQQATVTNITGAPIVMSGVGGGVAAPFNAFQACQGHTLNPGQSCAMSFQFTPAAPGSASATSNGSWNGQPFSIALHGTGIDRFLITPTAIEFGEILVNTTAATQPVTITNQSNQPVVMSGVGGGVAAPFNAFQACQFHTLNPGQSCAMSFQFTPAGPGPASGVSNGSWNGQAFSISLHGMGFLGAPANAFLITPAGLEFGNLPVGSTSTQQATVTNITGAPIVMSGLGGGVAAPFNAFQACQGHTLNPGQSCAMSFQFTPAAPGPTSATSNGSWNGQPFSIALHGTGIEQFLITPTGLDFGEVPASQTAQQEVTVTNVGTSPVVMSGLGGAVVPPFNASQDCQGNTVAAGASCHMTFSISSNVPGPYSATSVGSWNGQSFTISLTATVGVAVPVITTTLAPASPVLVGTSVHDTAVLTNATATASGTVSYSVYTDSGCTQLYAGHQPSSNPVTVVNGLIPPSGNVVFDQAGTFYWQATYSGDAANGPAISTCTSETVVVNKYSPTITTTLVPPGPLVVGSPVHDTSMLGGASPTASGTVTYAVYTDGACTSLYVAHQPSGNPVTVVNGSVPNSGDVVFDRAGTFYWQAVYSGDTPNNGATSACVSETLVVNAVLPAVSTTSPAPNITQTGALLAGNVGSDGGSPLTGRGIVYALSSVNPMPASGGAGVTTLTDAANTVGAFQEAASSLLPGSNYAFRAFAINAAGTGYGAPVMFTTLITAPGVTLPPTKGAPQGTQGPVLSKSFGASSLVMGSSTMLSFNVSNPNTSTLTGVAFTDNLPAGLTVSGPVTGTCDAGAIATTAASITLTGATLGPGASCSFSVQVTGTALGTWTNSASAVANATPPGVPGVASVTVVSTPVPLLRKGL